jgi:hypothetical protein
MFLLAGLGTPIAIAYSDACVVLDSLPSETSEYFGSQFNVTTAFSPVDIIDSCFADGVVGSASDNVFTILPSEYNFAAAAATPWFDANSGDNVSAGIKKSLMDTEHLAIDSLIGSGAGQGSCSQATEWTSASTATETEIADIESRLQIVVGAQGRGKSIQEVDFLKSLTADSTYTDTTLKAAKGCKFVKAYYNEIQDDLCGTALTGLSKLVTYFFALGVLGIFLVFFAICTSIKVFGRGHGGGVVSPDNFVN